MLTSGFDVVLQVYNVNDLYGRGETPLPVNININMEKVMGVFLAQLR